jgi:hypothetical protein
MERIVLIHEAPVRQRISEAELLRKRIKVNEQGIENLTFKIAETQDELEAAYRLTHDVYVKNGYMDICPSGLRFNFFNALPYTQTFIVKDGPQTVMTMSLFPDSSFGLPLDSNFQSQVDVLRRQGRYVAEVGANVSHINNQKAIMYLMKTMHTCAKDYLKVDDLVITVHPKHKNFYEYILGFEIIGEKASYSYVNSNPAVALKLDLRKNKKLYWDNYPREPLENDLHYFFFILNSKLISLPERIAPLRVWNNRLFNYFFKEKTNMYFEADDKTKELMEKYYGEYICA